MYLSRITLTNFKNYEEAALEFSPKINCFVGDNGVGKTNILDAIHYLSLTKSYFTTIDSLNIKHGETWFLVKGEFLNDRDKDEVYCGFHIDKRKVFRLNSKEYDRLSDHIGRFPVVMISPADINLVLEGSEIRRKFVNSVISQYDRVYLENVINYNKALKNRNKLLKEQGRAGNADREMLSLWERNMIPSSTVIHAERKNFTESIVPVFQSYYSHISESREMVELKYRSHLDSGPLDLLLDESYSRDQALQYTSKGIHRDDLSLLMNGHPLKEVASQGQQKSYLVALKLAKFDYISGKGSKTPILLMDDIFDKFDEHRVKQIIKLVSDNRFGQIFITDTHEERLAAILEGVGAGYKLFRINSSIEEIMSNGN